LTDPFGLRAVPLDCASLDGLVAIQNAKLAALTPLLSTILAADIS